jgi:hypothetical protein
MVCHPPSIYSHALAPNAPDVIAALPIPSLVEGL